MKKSKFSEEQILGILNEAQGDTPIKAVCARHNVSEATFYKWRAKFGGMDINEARRLRSLEDENNRLKRAVADLTVQVQILKEVNSKKVVSPSAKRRAIKSVVETGIGTTAEACRALGLARSSYYRNSTVSPESRQVQAQIVDLSQDHPRYGYAESFNGRFRQECLNRELLYTLSESRVVFEDWRQYNNHQRPHRSLGLQTPAQFALSQGKQGSGSSRATPSLHRNLGVEQNSEDKPKPSGTVSSQLD